MTAGPQNSKFEFAIVVWKNQIVELLKDFCICDHQLLPMFVLKRDGRKETVHFDKITSRINKLCYNLDANHVDASIISQKVVQGVYPGVTTVELDELAAQTAASLSTRHPDFSVLG